MKPGKVLSCMFLLVILGTDSAQNLENYKRWFCMLIQLTNRNTVFMKSMSTPKNVLEPSNINLSLFVCFVDVCRGC